ncbi:MAG: hypothetical protein ACJ8AW_08330 [Rhodopila sp.]
MAQKPPTKRTSSVIPFRPAEKRNPLPAAALPLPMAEGNAAPAPAPLPPALDLSGKRKVWFLIGRGRIGKTTLARWVAETMDLRGGAAIIAAADPSNRSLRVFFDGIAEPPSSNADDAKDWLRDLLQATMEEKLNAIIDLGGGNTLLSALLAEVPDLTDVLSKGGVEPVAVHVIGPEPHDLVPLAVTEAEGFQPAATAIVCNEAHGRRARFDQVLAHPTAQAALQRGAVHLWMPLLTPDAARLCDGRAWRYHDAQTKAGPFTASSIRTWLRRMGEEMAPITTWIPE